MVLRFGHAREGFMPAELTYGMPTLCSAERCNGDASLVGGPFERALAAGFARHHKCEPDQPAGVVRLRPPFSQAWGCELAGSIALDTRPQRRQQSQ